MCGNAIRCLSKYVYEHGMTQKTDFIVETLRGLNRQVLTQMTTEAMYQLAATLPPERRGLYADLGTATEEWLEFPGGVSNLAAVES